MKLALLLGIVVALTVATLSGAEVIVPTNSVWKYLDDGSDQGAAWRSNAFNDASWLSGPAELGYGDLPEFRPEATVLCCSNAASKFITYYFRRVFNVSNAASFSTLNIRLMRDDGAVVYLNGTEIVRDGMPGGAIAFNTVAVVTASGTDEYTFFNWTNLNPGLLLEGANLLAVEVHQNSQASTDVSFDLELNGDRSGPNTLPTVSIDLPLNNSQFAAPANIDVTATASDSDGSINRVDLFENGAFVRSEMSAPYEWTLSSRLAGSYSLRAVAVDNLGGRATSAPVSITVTGNVPPTASITSPAGGAAFVAPATIVIQASASDADGSVTNVEFYRNGSKIGEDAGSPYAFTNGNVGVGSHSLRLVAVDNSGARGTSAVVNISVNTNTRPAVSITNPPNGGTFSAPASIVIGANATDLEGVVSKVQFFVDGGLIGEDISSPFSWDWNSVGAGSYALLAVATDSGGLTATSSVVNVSIGSPGSAFTNSLVAAGAVWKYKDDGSDQATAWRAIAFNDSGWASGPAQLGYGDGDEVTEVCCSNAPTKFVTTYFRRDFVLTNASACTNLSLSLLRDDGGVVHLNGTEIFRSPNMPPGPITFNTLAGGTSAENFIDTATVNGALPLLINGANVVAVEIHQQALNSSDISFDLQLSGIFIGNAPSNAHPLVSISGPNNGASFPNPANIAIEASASDPDGTVSKVEFLANGAKIGEDTTSPYSFAWNGVGPDSYILTAIVTDNGGLAATSSPVNITVTGVANQRPTVGITFPGNGSTFNAPTNLIITTTASDPDGTVSKVEFFRSGVKIGEDLVGPSFTLDWTNALVGAFQLNAIATDNSGGSGTSAPVSLSFTGAAPAVLIVTGSVWKYFDAVTSPTMAGWNALGFDDSSWLSGPAELGYGDVSDGRPEATVVGYGPNLNQKYITTLFRRTINVPNPSAYTFLQLRVMRDDGAIVYINGAEVFRNNMPGAPTDFSTPAVNPISGADEVLFLSNSVPATVLVAGNNVVAVEIHQQTPASSDISFDLDLMGDTGAIINNPPTVAILSPANNSTYTEPANITVSVTASDSGGSVSKVEFYAGNIKIGEDTSAPFSLSWPNVTLGNYALTAVAIDNFGASATSAVVNVFVTASTAPVIANKMPAPGAVNSLTQVTVSFSEPVDGVSASDLLVNNVPSSGVSGSNAVYTFAFPQPAEGVVSITWAAQHGITDRESPPKPFDGTETYSTWSYTLVDTMPPIVISTNPVPGATLKALTQISVQFTEPVGGINASDLRINGKGATSVSGAGEGPFLFNFTPPANGTVTVNWTNNHGIRDFATASNSFGGGSWTYTLNTNLVEENVVINEIMYHPSSELASQEYIELYNKGGSALNLTGWRLSGGIKFAFPTYTLGAGKFLVVAANLAAFNAKYPAVTNVIGGWEGRLSNTDDDIDLDNALGQRVDSVHYSDEGDWSYRIRWPVDARGWIWADDHDGGGKSLELMNPAMANQYGQNWRASTPNNGTPGTTNSVARVNIPPMILDVAHFPAIPRSTDSVTITARILDEAVNGLTVQLFHRDHSTETPPAFGLTAMLDDGLHGDGLAGDGVFGVILPPMTANTVVEFYVSARDLQNQTNTWPAAARQVDGTTFAQTANALYQVDDGTYTGAQPVYRLIMTETERALLAQINGSNPNLDAQMNGTFVSVDSANPARIRYNIGLRLRGAGSRGANPPNYRLRIPSDRRWNGKTGMNLNTQFTYSQVTGNLISRKAGLVSEEAIAVQVRVNGGNLASSNGRQYGSYAHLESRDSDWAANHFPDDPNGNLYSCTRPSASLGYINPPTPGNYAGAGYTKDTNAGENDYSDLVGLTYALSTATPDSEFPAAVRRVLVPEQWLRALAVISLIGYGETSIVGDGQPDDYTLYAGALDRRVHITAHDHDTDLGQGDGSAQPPNNSIFRAADGNAQISRFVRHPEFVPFYYAELKHQLETTFSQAQIEPLIDQAIGTWVDSSVISAMKSWASQRRSSVWSQIPTNLTINPPALAPQNGYLLTTASSVSLDGRANVIETRSVKVNGQFANWTAWQGTWSVSGLALRPGLNRIVVEALDALNRISATNQIDIWYDDGNVANVSGAVAANTTWTAAGGPYYVTATVTVNAGATLTIEPGATVYFAAGAGLNVQGRLLAQGSEGQRIRFTRLPGAAGGWTRINFSGTGTIESRITYADIEYAGTSHAITANNSTIYLEHLAFANIAVGYVAVDNSSFQIRNCLFPSLVGEELIHGSNPRVDGVAIIEGNWFGTTTGLNDIIDFTGGQRPNAILQILNNVFSAASDDVLDLDGTDCHVEGNIFMNVVHDPATSIDDTSSAVSGGRDGGNTSEVTIVRNLFYNCEHAVLAKEGNFYTIQNNTIIHSPVAAINFGEPGRGLAGGAGAMVEGNIIFDTPLLFQNYTSAVMNVMATRNLLPVLWPGLGNIIGDPMLAGSAAVTWQNIRSSLALSPGSPALQAGPNGLDMGALVPAGATISGEPFSPTPLTNVTLTVAGPGITHYQYKVNSGGWSLEAAVATPITLDGLTNGSYTVQVVGKNSAGVWQATAGATVSRTWIVNSRLNGLRLNEVLAANLFAVPVGTKFPDLIELYNGGHSNLSLAGMGLSDEKDNPFKFVFSAGTTLAPGAYLTIYADNDATPPGVHTGFSLKQEGDELFLTAANGRLLDSVAFGLQIADRSIGRLPNGSWALCQPTIGSANQAESIGDPRTLRINEWLTAGLSPYPDDFIELFNPDPLPVALGGIYLSDEPIGAPGRHQIAPLSFVPGGGFAVFTADGQSSLGASHLNFQLSSEQGIIGLADADLQMIDCVIYGPQTTDVSEGRSPNGSSTRGFFSTPTPGSPNPSTFIPNGSKVVINEVFAYNVTKSDPDGGTPDWAELYNPTTNVITLSDMSLTDNPLFPRRFIFPVGVSLAPGGYLVVRFDPNRALSATNTGFGIKQSGGSIYLFDKLANGGSPLNSLTYGVQAADYSIGRVPDGSTNWTLTLPTRASANIAAALGSPAALQINEWMAFPNSGDDWFEIYNPLPQAVALGGLHLSDQLGSPIDRKKYPIPALSFIGTGLLGYQRFEADDNTAAGPEHTNFKLNNTTESIGLSDAAGDLIDDITYLNPEPGVSEGRLPDGSVNIIRFPGTASPADANYITIPNIVISEVLTHTDLPFEDAVELFNTSNAPVNIGGWFLSDAKHDLKKYRITNGVTIAANGFKTFYENLFNAVPGDPAAFSLSSAHGDEIYLSAADIDGNLTGYRATAKFGAAENGISFGRYQTSVGVDFTALSRRTFGVDSPDFVTEFRMGNGLPNAYPKMGPLVISEIMYHPVDLPGGLDNVADEFIELRNITSSTVLLYDPDFPTNRWRLRDAVDFDFPPNTVIAANGFLLVVSFDPGNASALAAFRAAYNLSPNVIVVGPYSGKLDNGGESVELYKPDPPQMGTADAGFVPFILVDRVKYSDLPPWAPADGNGQSLQRLNPDEYGNDPINWMAATPTPGPEGGGNGDTDSDGMPDTWEIANGLAPNDPSDAELDPDNDGASNLQEYLAGTDPQDGSSCLCVAIVAIGPPVLLQFNAQPDRTYAIEYKNSLTDPVWTKLLDIAAGPMRLVQATDPAFVTTRFYRLRTP